MNKMCGFVVLVSAVSLLQAAAPSPEAVLADYRRSLIEAYTLKKMTEVSLEKAQAQMMIEGTAPVISVLDDYLKQAEDYLAESRNEVSSKLRVAIMGDEKFDKETLEELLIKHEALVPAISQMNVTMETLDALRDLMMEHAAEFVSLAKLVLGSGTDSLPLMLPLWLKQLPSLKELYLMGRKIALREEMFPRQVQVLKLVGWADTSLMWLMRMPLEELDIRFFNEYSIGECEFSPTLKTLCIPQQAVLTYQRLGVIQRSKITTLRIFDDRGRRSPFCSLSCTNVDGVVIAIRIMPESA